MDWFLHTWNLLYLILVYKVYVLDWDLPDFIFLMRNSKYLVKPAHFNSFSRLTYIRCERDWPDFETKLNWGGCIHDIFIQQVFSLKGSSFHFLKWMEIIKVSVRKFGLTSLPNPLCLLSYYRITTLNVESTRTPQVVLHAVQHETAADHQWEKWKEHYFWKHSAWNSSRRPMNEWSWSFFLFSVRVIRARNR